MSSFLPNIIVTQAVNELGLKVSLDTAAVQQKIRAGLDRLYNFQHEDGGWGWWETDESHPFMTAYVVAGLTQAKAAGVQVDAERIERGAEWVGKAFAAGCQACRRPARVHAVCARGSGQARCERAGTDLRAAHEALALRPRDPRPRAGTGEGRSCRRDGGRTGAVAQQDSEQAWWTATRDQMLDFSEDATPEATAYAVKFLSHQRPNSPCCPRPRSG